MDPETRELRALEAEVAALQREFRMLQKSEEKTSGARYVALVHPSGPRTIAPGRLNQPPDSSGLRLPACPVLSGAVGDLLKCELESVRFCEDDDLTV